MPTPFLGYMVEPMWFIVAGAVALLFGMYGKVGKPDAVKAIGFVVLLVGVGLWFNPGMTASTAVGVAGTVAPSSSSPATTLQSSPGFSSVTVPLRAIARINNTATVYQGGTWTLMSDKGDFQTVVGGGSSTGVSSTLGPNSQYTGLVRNSSATLGFYGKKLAFSTGTVGKTVDAQVDQLVEPFIRIWDKNAVTNVSGWYNDAADSNVSDHIALGLTAGGSPANIEIRMDVGRASPYRAFGNPDAGNIVLCEDGNPSVFDNQYSTQSGTPLTKLSSIPTVASGDGMRSCWDLGKGQVLSSEGEIVLANAQIRINGAQAKANMTIGLYDSDNYISVDGRTVKSGIQDDTPGAADVGAGNPVTRIVT